MVYGGQKDNLVETGENAMNELISVIVPVYKVEDYLQRCVDSILNQSYNNLEIILVDDGSPDKCGKICDNYEKCDSRVKVIHRDNGGLSAARNSGLDVMKGKYVTFVDSDDWLDKNAILHMYTILLRSNTDFSAVGLLPVYDGKEVNSVVYQNSIKFYDRESALETFLFNDQLSPCACGKLWKSELWRELRFPIGKLFEDQYTIYKIIEKSKCCVLSSNQMYFYYKREGSIGHSSFSKRTYDLHYAICEEYEYITKKYPCTRKSMDVAFVMWEMVFINMMIRSNYIDTQILTEIRKFARKRIKNCLMCKHINKTRKIQIILFAYTYRLYLFTYKIYKKSHPLS